MERFFPNSILVRHHIVDVTGANPGALPLGREESRKGGQIRPVTHGRIPDSPQNNTPLMLGVASARLGYKEMRIALAGAWPLLRCRPRPFDSKSMRYLHEYDSIENKSL
jgi:hypothetical protein